MSILPDSAVKQGTVIHKSTTKYKRTFSFDFEAGEFALDTMNRVRTVNEGREVLVQIVSKILNDTRYKYLAYSAQYGNEVQALIAQDYPHEIMESELKRVITEALIYHPLIKDVRNFSFEGEGDTIFCSFEVVGINDIILQMQKEVKI